MILTLFLNIEAQPIVNIMYAVLFLAVIYQIIHIIFFPFIAIFLLVLHCKKRLFTDLQQRFGFVPTANQNSHVIWIHAVSVGEVLSTQEFINLVKARIPKAVCYLTVGTVTGKRIAQTHIKTDFISYLPYDFLPCMLLAYRRIKPKALIVVEAELWPNLLIIGKLKKIPLFLLNARINPRSLNRFVTFKFLFKTLSNCFATIFAQSEHDKTLFTRIGISPNNIEVLGNLKAFNVIAKKEETLQPLTFSPAPLSGSPTLLAGSIHPSEDELYLNLFASLKKTHPTLKLILAPRHFTWHQKLVENVEKLGLPFFVWSEQNPLPSAQNQSEALAKVFANHDILMLCKLGELFTLYPYANIFFLGGTFVPIGGHNLLEPAAWGVPTVIGPQHQNCQDIADRLTLVHGIVKVQSNDELFAKTKELLDNNARQQSIGKNSYDWVCQEATHVEKTLEILLKQLKQ